VGYFKTIHNPKTDWCYVTEPDPGLNGRSLKWPRGKVLGGSSSINGLLYVRGQRQDYDRWAELGCTGWNYESVLPYFKRAENQSRGEDEFHGVDGPLHVSDMSFKRPICDDFIKGVEEMGTPANEDINGEDQEGVGYFQLTAHKGRRCSSAGAYLKGAKQRANLTIITKAMVKKIGIDDGRATKVHYLRNGQAQEINANREIILSAGAIGSPQLLQISGIGPGAHLQSLGIDVKVDSPDVGENLQDHLQIRAVYKTIQYHFQPLSADSPGEGLHPFSAITASVCQLRPESRGSIHVQSADADVHPLIVPNYLSTDLDCKTAIESLKFTRGIMNTEAMKDHIAEELLPDSAATSDDEILDQARNIANTIYHPTSTCRMGADDRSVLDPRLRVRGVAGLRVVDASVMPEIVSGNTNAPTIMIGEKASDMILEDRKS